MWMPTFFTKDVRIALNRFHDPTRYSKAVCCVGRDANVDRYSKSSLGKVCYIVFRGYVDDLRSIWINGQAGEQDSIYHVGIETINS